jgi:hypothetical protein
MTRLPAAPAALAALEAGLRARAAALAQEVRSYPTPIARCDDQLTGLLERRSRLFRACDALEAYARSAGSAAALAALDAAFGALAPGDLDAALAATCEAAIGSLRAEYRARPGGCGAADAWANDGAPAA